MLGHFVFGVTILTIVPSITWAQSSEIPTLDVRPVCRGIASQSADPGVGQRNQRETFQARQNDQINPSTTIPTTQVPAAVRSSRLSCGKVRKAQNIHLSSGVIWGIPERLASPSPLGHTSASVEVLTVGGVR